jgi:hypothetical protein
VPKSHSILAPCPGEMVLALLIHLAHAAEGEYVALLGNPGRFASFRRRDDLFDDGVAALFGLEGADAELLGFSFHAGKFTAAEAATWMNERAFTRRLFVSNASVDRRH